MMVVDLRLGVLSTLKRLFILYNTSFFIKREYRNIAEEIHSETSFMNHFPNKYAPYFISQVSSETASSQRARFFCKMKAKTNRKK
jgi:hypothetical protein